MDLADVGSTTRTGREFETGDGRSALTFAPFDLKKRGLRQVGWKQEGSTQTGSLHTGSMQYEEFVQDGPLLEVRRVGLTQHLRDKSKSESIMCPSSLTKTFSGFKSL